MSLSMNAKLHQSLEDLISPTPHVIFILPHADMSKFRLLLQREGVSFGKDFGTALTMQNAPKCVYSISLSCWHAGLLVQAGGLSSVVH